MGIMWSTNKNALRTHEGQQGAEFLLVAASKSGAQPPAPVLQDPLALPSLERGERLGATKTSPSFGGPAFSWRAFGRFLAVIAVGVLLTVGFMVWFKIIDLWIN